MTSPVKQHSRYPLLQFCARLGTRMGHSPSMVLLGAIYESGRADADGIDAANQLYRRAASKGNAHAMYNLGVNHLSSKGFEADHEQAVYWLKQAAEHGYGMALWAVGKMYLAGRLVEMDVDRGLAMLRKAATLGCHPACLTLVDILRQGSHGVAIDQAEADQWLLKTRSWRDRLLVRLGWARVVEK